ncbi:ABC transporter ATP-binding protein [Paenibacillus sp. FSL R5-0527]|uniref:ABC transporter ATP-binding protein n=1 Tax=Paenibacillus sp. FSL R5-0527 TaxID=2975321 RepID=UPI00097A79E6|nr:hypothetical protein BK140_04455 [Paenibacillus macerans]
MKERVSAVLQSGRAAQHKDSLYHTYRWVLSYVRKYYVMFLILVCCGLGVTLIQISIPKGVQYFIDVIVPLGDQVRFRWLIIFLVAGMFIMFGLMALQNLLQRSIQEKAARDIQYDIFKHMREMGIPYFEQRPIGESLSFMNTEVSVLQDFYRFLLPHTIQNIVVSIVSIVVMCAISVPLTLIIVPCMFLYYLVGPSIEKKATVLAKENTQQRISYNQKVYESVSALTELRAHGAEAWDRKRLMEHLQLFLDGRVRMLWMAFWRGSIRRMSYYIGGIAVILYGIHLVKEQALSVGEMSAYLLYYFQVMQTLTLVITVITEQRVLMHQAARIHRFIQTEPQVVEAAELVTLSELKGEIRFSHVAYRYDNGPEVLLDFDLMIKPGQRLAIVGPSGHGKSTVLKLMLRFYDPLQGEILLDGVPIQKLSFSQLRENIGYVSQETFLFGDTIRNNILFGNPEAKEEDMLVAAKAACAHEFICTLPEGYDTLLGERGVNLSGGQKQRISIARMFIKKPSVVLLDEATSALDTASEKEVQAALDHLLVGRTTITVAHRLSTIRDYDLIVVLEQGRIREMGSHDELMSRQGAYYHLITGEQG